MMRENKSISRFVFPKRIHVELSSKCNLSCPICARELIDENTFMSWHLWKKIVDECSQYKNVTIFPYWRGESMLHPEFNKFISYAISKKIKIEITTNGTCVDQDNIGIINKMHFVNISIHNANAYESYLKIYDSRQGLEPILQASFVEGEQTINKYAELIKQYLKGEDRVRIYKNHYNNKSEIENENQQVCKKLTDLLVIGANGKVSRCTYLWRCENILDATHMSIFDIWNSNVFHQIVNNYPDYQCRTCKQWKGRTCGDIYYLQDDKIVSERIR